jgi:hypothetical protein
MLTLRYYHPAQVNDQIICLLEQIKRIHNIPYNGIDLSRGGQYDEQKDRQVYERDFKPRARMLKKRTGESLTTLRSRRARNYFVSLPGTIAIVGDEGIEWYTLGDAEILVFLRSAVTKGLSALHECCV